MSQRGHRGDTSPRGAQCPPDVTPLAGGAFAKELAATFEGDYTLEYHLAPPLVDAVLGVFGSKREPTKRTFGPWMGKALTWLARGKKFRGTAMDVFGYSAERRAERAAIRRYEEDVAMLLDGLNSSNHATAVSIAGVPELVRGFGHVKAAHLQAATTRRDELLAVWRTAGSVRDAA